MNNTNPAFNHWTKHLATHEQIEDHKVYMEQLLIVLKLQHGLDYIQKIMDASPIKGL